MTFEIIKISAMKNIYDEIFKLSFMWRILLLNYWYGKFNGLINVILLNLALERTPNTKKNQTKVSFWS